MVLLGGADSAGVVQAWFQGTNPLLENMAPVASRARQLAQYPQNFLFGQGAGTWSANERAMSTRRMKTTSSKP